MASVTDGTYRVSLAGGVAGGLTLTDLGEGELMMFPVTAGTQLWLIKRTDNTDDSDDRYTIATPSGDRFAGWEGDPDLYEPIRLYPEPTEWIIIDGPGGTFIIVAPGTPLTLGLSPLLIFPPRVALSPRFDRDGGWTLQRA